MNQEQPNITENQLLRYGNTFFGFGEWNADVWLVGLEEWGAETSDEFCRRYQAWNDMRSAELVDLQTYFNQCNIAPIYTNPTWRTLHRICIDAGMLIPNLGENNNLWGRSYNVARNSGHIALIEAMPFPAPSTAEWPYEDWHWDFMKSREACATKFRQNRLNFLMQKLGEYRPKAVIDYGGAWKVLQDIPFTAPILYRMANIGPTRWISPVKIAGARPFDNVARNQTTEQLQQRLQDP